jgi:protein-S-isoprenylcysteine O-methyltransferase Ste14
VRLYWRLATGSIHDRLFTRREGILPVVLRWTIGVPLFAATGIYIFCPGAAAWMYLWLPFVARLGGALVGFLSVYLILLVHRELGSCFSSTLLIRSNHRLVRTGPYRFVRHPMYSSYLLLFIGAFLVSGNWVVGLSGTGVIVTLMTVRIAREEALLLERFGAEYEEYRATTGMFIPMTHRLPGRARSAKNPTA